MSQVDQDTNYSRMKFCRITSRNSGREIIFPEHGISIPIQDQAFIAAMALDFADKLNLRNPEEMQYILKSISSSRMRK